MEEDERKQREREVRKIQKDSLEIDGVNLSYAQAMRIWARPPGARPSEGK